LRDGGLIGRRLEEMNIGVIDDSVGRELAMGLGRRKKDREGVFVDCGIKGNEDEMNEGHKKK